MPQENSSDSIVQSSLPFTDPIQNKSRRNKLPTVIRLGDPAIPVKITEYGTYLAKLEHVWLAARRYARRNGYKVIETYGVVGVAPF